MKKFQQYISSKNFKTNFIVLVVFIIIFFILLLPIPINNLILGRVDSLLGIGFSNLYMSRFERLFTGADIGEPMYPANITQYGESSFGGASVFILYRLLGFNDVYAHFLFQVTLFCLSAFGVFLVTKYYSSQLLTGIFAGLAFSLSGFLWANIDDLVIHFYFLPCLSIYFLHEAIKNENRKSLYAAALVGGIQMYFSVQVFVYQTIMLLIILLINVREVWHRYSVNEKVLALILYTLIPLPLFFYYYKTVTNLGVIDMWSDWLPTGRMEVMHFLRVLPNKLIEYPFTDKIYEGVGWSSGDRRAGFVGIGLPLLALLGIINFSKKKLELIIILLIGILLSFGTVIKFHSQEYISPISYLYRYIPFFGYLRGALRSFTFGILALSILAGLGLENILIPIGKKSQLAVFIVYSLLLFFILGENVSFSLNKFEQFVYPEISDDYIEYFKDKPSTIILDLPSNSTKWPDYINEGTYLLWQTKHKRDILGGVSGYYPITRIETQKYTDLLPSEEAFKYFKDSGVTHFVWHKSANLVGNHSQPNWIDNVSFLTLSFENDVIRIYEFNSNIEYKEQNISSRMGVSLKMAGDYLRESQLDDGSWMAFGGKDPTFPDNAQEEPHLFGSMFIVHALQNSSFKNYEMVNLGREYIRNQMFENSLWTFDGPQHELTYKFNRVPCILGPDSDDTSLGWVVIGGMLDLNNLPNVVNEFEKNQIDNGTFRSLLSNVENMEYDCGDEFNKPSLGVQINILSFFSKYNVDSQRLLSGIKSMIKNDGYWEKELYYKDLPFLAYLTSNAIHEGASALHLLEKFIGDFEKNGEYKDIKSLDTLQLASYIKSRCHLSILYGEKCNYLDSSIEELLSRQRYDGSFPAAPLYEASVGFYGSPTQTTAIAIWALEIVMDNYD